MNAHANTIAVSSAMLAQSQRRNRGYIEPMATNIRAFINAVERHVGRCDRPALDEAVLTTLRALGRHLGGVPPELSDSIPFALQPVIESGLAHPKLGPAALYLRLSNEIGLPVGTALEIAQSVMAELAARLPESACRQMRLRLPPGWASFVESPELREAHTAAVA